MRDHSGWIGKTYTLSCSIDIAEQAPASGSRATAAFTDDRVPDSRKIDDDATVTGAESCQAMPAASYCGGSSCGSGSLNRDLHVADVGAAEDQRGSPSHHSIPNGADFGELRISGAKHVAAEAPFE